MRRGEIEALLPAPSEGRAQVVIVVTADRPEGQIHCFGELASTEGEPLQLDAHSRFELACGTKLFTALLFEHVAARLPWLEDAKLGEIEPPGGPFAASLRDVPLRAILSYTSGVPADNLYPENQHLDHMQRPERPYTSADLFDHARRPGFEVEASGVAYNYSSLGFALLAELLPIALGDPRPFAALLRDTILAPLGLCETGFFDGETEGGLARCYTVDGRVTAPGSGGFPAHHASAGLISTPADLLTWLRFNMGLMPGHPLAELVPRVQAEASGIRTHSGLGSGRGWFRKRLETARGSVCGLMKSGGQIAYVSWIGLVEGPPGEPSPAGVLVLSNAWFDARKSGVAVLSRL